MEGRRRRGADGLAAELEGRVGVQPAVFRPSGENPASPAIERRNEKGAGVGPGASAHPPNSDPALVRRERSSDRGWRGGCSASGPASRGCAPSSAGTEGSVSLSEIGAGAAPASAGPAWPRARGGAHTSTPVATTAAPNRAAARWIISVNRAVRWGGSCHRLSESICEQDRLVGGRLQSSTTSSRHPPVEVHGFRSGLVRAFADVQSVLVSAEHRC